MNFPYLLTFFFNFSLQVGMSLEYYVKNPLAHTRRYESDSFNILLALILGAMVFEEREQIFQQSEAVKSDH